MPREGQSARSRHRACDPGRPAAGDFEQFPVRVDGRRGHAARAHVPILMVAEHQARGKRLPVGVVVGEPAAADRQAAGPGKREAVTARPGRLERQSAQIRGRVDVDRPHSRTRAIEEHIEIRGNRSARPVASARKVILSARATRAAFPGRARVALHPQGVSVRRHDGVGGIHGSGNRQKAHHVVGATDGAVEADHGEFLAAIGIRPPHEKRAARIAFHELHARRAAAERECDARFGIGGGRARSIDDGRAGPRAAVGHSSPAIHQCRQPRVVGVGGRRRRGVEIEDGIAGHIARRRDLGSERANGEIRSGDAHVCHHDSIAEVVDAGVRSARERAVFSTHGHALGQQAAVLVVLSGEKVQRTEQAEALVARRRVDRRAPAHARPVVARADEARVGVRNRVGGKPAGEAVVDGGRVARHIQGRRRTQQARPSHEGHERCGHAMLPGSRRRASGHDILRKSPDGLLGQPSSYVGKRTWFKDLSPPSGSYAEALPIAAIGTPPPGACTAW